ncbi:TauD/TfdA dioxygenase family protein [Streptomyces sp. NPDC052236]|uniref:TauD/TfdA dioxygenase family protein n=1 Tax=Streptomyces sp. NPDC052236 TaxID=3365686 RepID=UPI0037CD7C50
MSLSLRPLDDSGFGRRRLQSRDRRRGPQAAAGASPAPSPAADRAPAAPDPRRTPHRRLLLRNGGHERRPPLRRRRLSRPDRISNIVEGGEHVGIYDGDNEEEWHADNSFKPELTATTLLYSVITPEEGGETRFADANRAYADLHPAVRQRIDGMRAVHSIEQLGALRSQASGGQSSAAAGSLAGHPEVEHPLVLTHPVTGARSLLLGSMVIRCITGLSETVSRALLDDLLEHTTSAPYIYSHRWSQGDLVVWDNLATLHTASPCDSSRHSRLLYRAAVRQPATSSGSAG